MSKKVFNVFSILCFALVLCFIGCTELINPKTETDINLNIDLSKIIKSTRNTGETQSSASLGENPTIKVAIYDAKKYTATTNSTENLGLITEAQAKIVDNEAKVKLNNIPVGIYAIVFAELSFSNENSTEVMYAGNSEVFKVKASNNKISLVLKKVVDDEVKPDDSNTPYDISSWDELKTQINKLSDDTTPTEFIIMNNLTATSTITVSTPVKIISGKDVKITRGIEFSGTFFIIDTGSLELGSEENKIILDGGKLSNINATDPLIWECSTGQDLTLTNCSLQYNTLNNTANVFGNGGAVKVESNFTMNNSSIIECFANVNGGAVYVSGGTFTMNNSSIKNCSANENGGAVYITGKGTFNMNGGSIAECYANSGGGVWMNSGSSFTMFGGKIDTCNSSSEGGGVYVAGEDNPCTFEMLDSTIIGCSAENGGGICLYGKLTMKGGAYVDSSNDNDVYLASETTVTVAGELTHPIVATITPENYEEGTQVLTADDTNLLALSVGKFALTPITSSADGTNYEIDSNGMIAKVLNVNELTQEVLKSKIDTTNFRYTLKDGEYYVKNSIQLSYPIVIEGNVKIYSDIDVTIFLANGYQSNDSSWFGMIVVPSANDTLTLSGNLTIDGTNNSSTTLDYLVMSSGTFNLSNNVSIKNGDVKFGAVYIGGGTFNMTGGTIENNTTTLSCSGIYTAGGTTNISGGTISNNFVNNENKGASIYCDSTNATVYLPNNSTVTSTTGMFTQNIVNGVIEEGATGGGGNESLIQGAYYVSADGDDSNNNGSTYDKPFKTLNKAITSANNSGSKTVYVIGTLNATSESSSDNETVFYIAASVGTADSPINIIGYPDSDATLSALDDTGVANKRVFETNSDSYIKMKDLILTGGNTSKSGAAIYYYNGELTLEDCKINGNETTYSANSDSGIYYDGIYMYGSSNKLNMKNTTCSDGIYLYNSTATIGDGCSLGYDQNESPIIHIDNSQLTLSGSVQLNNPIYSDAKSPISVGSTLTTHNINNKITIKLSDYSNSTQILSVEDELNLVDEVQKFSLADSAYSITDQGLIE